MYKLIPLGLIILILLSSIYLTDMEFVKKEAWSQYSASRYESVRLGKQDLLLIKSLQPDEYDVIFEQLVDSEKEPLTQQQLQQLKRDRNSYFPDNILPDGRYLKENHLELENQIYQEMTKPVVMGDESQVIQQVTVSLGNKATLICNRIKLKEGFALRPVSEINYRYFNYMISDNGSQTIVELENGIWTIDAATMHVQRITEMNDDTYAALQASSFKRFGMNQVFANSFVTVNATLDRIAYVSNRDSFDEGTLDLYLVNSATGKETVFKADKEIIESFRPEKWLDDESLLVSNMS